MKKNITKTGLFVIILLVLSGSARSQDYEPKEKAFYFGIGTSISSFLGGDLGSRFGIRFAADDDYESNNYNNYYYNKDNTDRNSNNNSPSLSPTQFSLVGGLNVTSFAALELETSLIWHSNGKIEDPNYQYGTRNGFNTVERNANSSLLAIPLTASLKIFPLGKNNSSVYISGGYGFQFVHESVDRLRDYFMPGYYYNTLYAQQVVSSHSDSDWQAGFRTAIGMSYNMFGNLGGVIELSYSSFKTNPGTDDMLTINKISNIGNISLGTKMFLGL